MSSARKYLKNFLWNIMNAMQKIIKILIIYFLKLPINYLNSKQAKRFKLLFRKKLVKAKKTVFAN